MIGEQEAQSKSKAPDYLFRSGLLGALVLFVGMILSDPNKDAPDWAASMVFALLGLPFALASLMIIFVCVLLVAFRPVLRMLGNTRGATKWNVWLAIFLISAPVAVIVWIIDGSTLGHVISALVALAAACLLFQRKNRHFLYIKQGSTVPRQPLSLNSKKKHK